MGKSTPNWCMYLLLISGNSGVQKRMAYQGIVPYTLLKRFSKETTLGLGRITEEGMESYLASYSESYPTKLLRLRA